ncbi:hypothetical protein KM043_003605 [Ampulex compressa]|nr:hypothetical protein KM043_003605 [Ampulex compressa]
MPDGPPASSTARPLRHNGNFAHNELNGEKRGKRRRVKNMFSPPMDGRRAEKGGQSGNSSGVVGVDAPATGFKQDLVSKTRKAQGPLPRRNFPQVSHPDQVRSTLTPK